MSITRVRRGEPLKIKADDWNRMADVAERTDAGPGTLVDSTGVYRSDPERKISLVAQIVTIHDDYLACTVYDERRQLAGGNVKVAKPWMLRRTPFDGIAIVYPNGQTITYTYVDDRERDADDGATNETQVMTPDYYVGEVIDAFEKMTGVLLPDGTYAIWQDRNTCGRFWALEA